MTKTLTEHFEHLKDIPEDCVEKIIGASQFFSTNVPTEFLSILIKTLTEDWVCFSLFVQAQTGQVFELEQTETAVSYTTIRENPQAYLEGLFCAMFGKYELSQQTGVPRNEYL